MAFKSLIVRLVVLTLAATAIHGCASSGKTPDEKAEFERNNDPFEIPNRFVFAFNRAVDTIVLRPVAVFYRDLVPVPTLPFLMPEAVTLQLVNTAGGCWEADYVARVDMIYANTASAFKAKGE